MAIAAAKRASVGWDGPGLRATLQKRSWDDLVWTLVWPRRRHRIAVTVPGLFLIALALGIGTAAYNTANNILFLTLSLLLACLLLSGLLSWMNFRRLRWRLRADGPWRAGHDTLVRVEVANDKLRLPAYGLWFDFVWRDKPQVVTSAAASKKELKVRETLAAAAKAVTHSRQALRVRVEPRGTATVEWLHHPLRRGVARIELAAVGSLFPFGFLSKSVGTPQSFEALVWPARVEYTWEGGGLVALGTSGRRASRGAGGGEDLRALRAYRTGDSHRLIHWKASARRGRMLVRELAAETPEGFCLEATWPSTVRATPEQFELFCQLAATLAEDWQGRGLLRAVRTVGLQWREVRRHSDLEEFLNALARYELPTDSSPAVEWEREGRPRQGAFVTLAPEGNHGVAAYVDGRKTATA